MKATSHLTPRWADVSAAPAWPSDATDGSVAQRFEDVVSADPAAPAFFSPAGDVITYGELNTRANKVAHLIRERFAGEGGVVGLLARHPAAAITGMLGSLKAGQLYVPLDPSDPPSRLEHIVDDSTARMILAAPEHLEVARGLVGTGSEVFEIGKDEHTMPGANPEIDVAPTDPAYVLYTSGSTGVPKGVLLAQRNLLVKGVMTRSLLGVGRDDRVSLLFGPATGAATTGIFGSLLNGAAVCPYDLKMHGLHRLGDWLDERAVTVLHIVPTVFRRFADLAEGEATYESIRAVILPGEPVFGRDVDVFRRHLGPDAVLVPRLSATETSMVACDFVSVDSAVEDDILSVARATISPWGIGGTRS
jgi:non-ribosomal peptide synthetase component F